MERASALASDRSARKSSRRSALIAAGSIVVTGVALAVAFFPVLFSLWGERDDEGVFVYALREFLSHHGHLYSTIWSDFYGPFYYLVMSTVFRVIHQQPSLENGRWIVLILTTASAGLFGASVWRITKSLPCTILCEIAAFLILIEIAGNEPMHPGSLGVLLVSVVAFELSSYAATRRTLHLVMIGAATGALLMTKVNTGGVVAVAVVFGFVVGNEKVPRWMQMVVGALAALVPVALISQNISLSWADTFAVVVTASIIGLFAVVFIDQLSLPRWPLVPIAAGAGVVMLCSLAFPVLSGTSLRDEISGVFVRPLTLPTAFNVPAQVHPNWLIIVLTVAGIFAAVAFRSLSPEAIRTQSTWTHVALAGVGLWLLGLGSMVFARGWIVAEWLPAIVLLPALAFCARTPEPNRLALRLVALLATLQILVVYPVAGSQVGWGTVAMVVPCAIALAAGLDHSRVWRESPALMRVVATATVVLVLFAGVNYWPTTLWKTYLDNPRFGVPGTGLMRVDPAVAATVQAVAAALREQCDTFYGVPSQNGFYIFSGLPPATEMLANGGPAGLTEGQRAQVLQQLEQKQAAGERVCILRDSSQGIVVPPGPLADALSRYSTVVGTVGTYTISRRT